MTHNMNLISNYIILVGVITNIALIALQVSTFRKTKHSSLVVMAISSIIGLLYILVAYGARQYWAAGHDPLALYLVAAVLLTTQSIVGVLSVLSLFRAFEQASIASRGGA